LKDKEFKEATVAEAYSARWGWAMRHLTHHARILCPKEECEAITATNHMQMAKNIVAMINKYHEAAKLNIKVGLRDDGINLQFAFSPDQYVELHEEGKPTSLRFSKKELELLHPAPSDALMGNIDYTTFM